MSKSVVEVLTEARAKIRKGWCQKLPAADIHGDLEDASGKAAVAWCSFGALLAVTDEYGDAMATLQRLLPDDGLINWNDAHGRTQAEVVALFDRAIEKASASE